jgi:ribosome-binding factor A
MGKRSFPVRGGPKGSPSQRMLRVGELIRRTLSDLLLRGAVHDPALGAVPITVGEVRCSPDLRHATVFVLPLGGANTAETLVALDRNRAEIRRLVAEAINLKYAPELRFRADESFDRIEETRRLLGSESVRRDLGGGA